MERTEQRERVALASCRSLMGHLVEETDLVESLHGTIVCVSLRQTTVACPYPCLTNQSDSFADDFTSEILTDGHWLTHRRVLLAVIWVSLVILTHIPVPQTVQGLGVSDKLIHLVGYFPLGLLFASLSPTGV